MNLTCALMYDISMRASVNPHVFMSAYKYLWHARNVFVDFY